MRIRQRKGQLAGWEALIIIILLGVSGYMFYLYAHKPSEANIYQKGSKPIVSELTPHCGFLSCCNNKVDEFMGERNAITNKNSH